MQAPNTSTISGTMRGNACIKAAMTSWLKGGPPVEVRVRVRKQTQYLRTTGHDFFGRCSNRLSLLGLIRIVGDQSNLLVGRFQNRLRIDSDADAQDRDGN